MDIVLNKNLNRTPIKFKKDIGIRFFKEVVIKFNNLKDLSEVITITNQELREILNLTNPLDLKQFQRDFHDNDKGIFKTVMETSDGKTISGGLLLTEVDGEQTRINVRINPFWQDYFYSKLDIDTWCSVGGRSEEIEVLEIEEPKKVKLKQLMFSITSPNIKGKYSKRLVDLLMQFKKDGYFVMKWNKFREIMEIPESYKTCNIDQQVLTPARKELEREGVCISKINKVKLGKSINKIEIFFKIQRSLENKNTKKINEDIKVEIERVKRNIYISKAWDKRANNKLYKLLENKGKEYVTEVLKRLYEGCKSEITCSLVQYINGVVKNMELEYDKPQPHKKVEVTMEKLQRNYIEDKALKNLSEEEIQTAMKKCLDEGNVGDLKFLENLRSKSKTIFENTMKRYL